MKITGRFPEDFMKVTILT